VRKVALVKEKQTAVQTKNGMTLPLWDFQPATFAVQESASPIQKTISTTPSSNSPTQEFISLNGKSKPSMDLSISTSDSLASPTGKTISTPQETIRTNEKTTLENEKTSSTIRKTIWFFELSKLFSGQLRRSRAFSSSNLTPVGKSRCDFPARVVAGGMNLRERRARRQSCAALRGADGAARHPYLHSEVRYSHFPSKTT
jgi:hypothetical protein